MSADKQRSDDAQALVQKAVQAICWNLNESPNATMANKAAVEVLQEAAELKSANAHYYLGALYFNASTGEERLEDAFTHLKIAYELGHNRGLQPLQSLHLKLQAKANRSLFTNFCGHAEGYKSLNDQVFEYIVAARRMETLQETPDRPVDTGLTQYRDFGVTLP